MKTKALISFAVTAKLICVLVFAYAKIRFSHDKAKFIYCKATFFTAIYFCDFVLMETFAVIFQRMQNWDYAKAMYSVSSVTFSCNSFLPFSLSRKNAENKLLAKIN